MNKIENAKITSTKLGEEPWLYVPRETDIIQVLSCK